MDKDARHENDETVNRRRFPKISARLGVDGRDKPGQDGLLENVRLPQAQRERVAAQRPGEEFPSR
jgi:hypothetical protein